MKLLLHYLAIHLKRLLCLIATTLLILAPGQAAPSNVPIRIGLPDSLFNLQYLLISEWRQYLENKLKRPVEFIVHRKFSNTTVQLFVEKLDFAWVTDYPDVHLKGQVRLLAVPLQNGQPYFSSYLIVPAYNDRTLSLLQLKGAVFAFTDPSLNGSYLEVRHELLAAGENPGHFFGKTIFVRSHREVIKAVALGLAHAGEVDSRIWDLLAQSHPELTAQTRIVAKSHAYGAPPLIANHFVAPEDFSAMQRVLTGMAADPKGLDLLKRLGLDGFIPGDEGIYERMVTLKQQLGE